MPRVKLTKTLIDALPTPQFDIVYWDAALPCFGVKVTPKGRKVFIVLYRAGGAGSKAVQVYHRLIRTRDPASRSRSSTEGIRRKAGWARSGGREMREETSGGGRSRG